MVGTANMTAAVNIAAENAIFIELITASLPSFPGPGAKV
jgi:hypothetical protein